MSESLTNDKFCEELSHPHLFTTGKFGFQTKRKVQLSPSKYFNHRLLNYTQARFFGREYKEIELSRQVPLIK